MEPGLMILTVQWFYLLSKINTQIQKGVMKNALIIFNVQWSTILNFNEKSKHQSFNYNFLKNMLKT